MPPTAFITSATGTLGGALARHLLTLHWTIHFTTRNPTSPAALALTALGAHVFPGSWDDLPALTTALTSCTHLFINTMPSFTDATAEITQAKNILLIAKQLSVTHVIYSGALPTFSLPQWDPAHWTAAWRLAKVEIEKAVREAGIENWAILRPGYFMANFLGEKVVFQHPLAKDTGVFKHAYGKGEVLPLVDEADVARVVVKAWTGGDEERWKGREVAVASERVTAGEVIEILRRVSRKEILGEWLGDEEREREEGSVRFSLENQRSFAGIDGLVDWEVVRGLGVELGTFEGYLRRERESLDETYVKVKAIE